MGRIPEFKRGLPGRTEVWTNYTPQQCASLESHYSRKTWGEAKVVDLEALTGPEKELWSGFSKVRFFSEAPTTIGGILSADDGHMIRKDGVELRIRRRA